MKETKASERRRKSRFQVKIGGLALLSSQWPRSTVVGDILDISEGGIALQYLGDEPDLEKVDEVGIACSDPPCYVGTLPVKTVADQSMTKIPFGTLVPRRLSLKFDDLTVDQSKSLETFIRSQAVSSV